MIQKTKNGITWLEYELFAEFKNLTAGVTLRHRDFNLGFSVTDVKQNEMVEQNRNLLSKTLNLYHLKDCKLEHKDLIVDVEGKDQERPVCDALTTNRKNQALMVTHADCQAAIFFDPIKQALAIVHSGWRGSVQNILGKTVLHMKARYSCDPANIHIAISPSLGPQSAEFIHYEKELPSTFYPFQIKPFYFDFWAISEMQLKEVGILDHHLQITRVDTFTNTKDYFSYRKEKITGRLGSFCQLGSP